MDERWEERKEILLQVRFARRTMGEVKGERKRGGKKRDGQVYAREKEIEFRQK